MRWSAKFIKFYSWAYRPQIVLIKLFRVRFLGALGITWSHELDWNLKDFTLIRLQAIYIKIIWILFSFVLLPAAQMQTRIFILLMFLFASLGQTYLFFFFNFSIVLTINLQIIIYNPYGYIFLYLIRHSVICDLNL